MQGNLLSNSDEGDTGVIEDFDEGADIKYLATLGFRPGVNVRVLFARAGAVKVLINEEITQSLNREHAETVILEA